VAGRAGVTPGDSGQMTDGTEYKGYTIVAMRGAGPWRVYIRPPNAAMTRHEFPASLVGDAVIAEAKRLIDEMVAATPRRGRG
jgi:hypothetical protein